MSEPLTVRQLEAFAATAEELHFGRAANRLGISQPSLSQLMSRIEQAVGAELFRRRPSVRLTTAGELLLPRVQDALQALGEGLAGVRDLASGTSGRLRIRFAASALVSQFPKVLREFRRQFPLVHVDLWKGSSAAIGSDLGADEVGVARYRPGNKPLRGTTLIEEPFVVALPNEHRLLNQDQIDLSDLKDEAFVHFPRRETPGLHDEIGQACQAHGFEPRVVLEATEWLTIMGLVRAGLGVSLVPASFQRLRWAGAEYRPLGPGGPSSAVVVSHGPSKASPTVQHFLRAVRQAAGDKSRD